MDMAVQLLFSLCELAAGGIVLAWIRFATDAAVIVTNDGHYFIQLFLYALSLDCGNGYVWTEDRANDHLSSLWCRNDLGLDERLVSCDLLDVV